MKTILYILCIWLFISAFATPSAYVPVYRRSSKPVNYLDRAAKGFFVSPTVVNIVTGEYATPVLLSDSSLVIFSAVLGLTGNGGAGTSGVPLVISSGLKFVFIGNTLHGTSAIDKNGNVYVTGNNTDGEFGLGSLTSPGSLTQVTVDSRGLPFTNITIVQGSYIQIGADDLSGQYFVKHGTLSDSVFYAGVDKYGMGGSGNITQTTFLSPALQFGLPSGQRIIQMTSEAVTVMLLNNGQVFSWGAAGTTSFLGRPVSGNNYATPIQVTGFDDSVRQICGGNFNGVFALSKTGKLYGWGPHAGYLGNASDPAYTSPRDLTDSVTHYMVNGTTRTFIAKIVANSVCAHALMNDGSIFWWGDGSQSSGGDGTQPNLASPGGGSTPWFMDPSAVLALAITHPRQVTNKFNYTNIFGGSLFGFTFFATDPLNLWGAGRNKGSVLGNGVIECNGDGGDLSNFYPNSWDQPNMFIILWQSIISAIQQTTPGCASGAVTANCHSCGTTTSVTSNAGSNQTITNLFTSLDGSGSSCVGGKIVYYLWSQTGGSAATIDAVAAIQPNVTFPGPGTYTFNLFVRDQGTIHTSNSTVVVTVLSPGTGIGPIPIGSTIIVH